MTVFQNVEESAQFIKKSSTVTPEVGLVLGSGLGSFGDHVDVDTAFGFSEIPHFCPSTVDGHSGKLLIGQVQNVPVAVLQGRLHPYEGHSFQDVVHPIRVMARLGVKTLVVTNSSGGLLPAMKPGDFMVIKDHINLTGNNPLVGPNIPELGPRFVDMSEPYDRSLSELLKTSLKKAKARFHEGVYCGVLGPTYETAAEIRFFQKIGGGAVGMSTVAEVIAAKHAGLKVAGISCITNLGTGLSDQKLNHEDVKEVAHQVESTFTSTLLDFLSRLSSHSKQ